MFEVMHRDRHMVGIGCAENFTNLSDMFGIIEVDIGIAEVELETDPEVRIARAASNCAQGVFPKRVYTAEGHVPARILLHRPIVFFFHLRVFVL